MKPRLTHLLLASLALAALGGGVAILRFLPGVAPQRGASPAQQTAMAAKPAVGPIGGAMLPGLRRGVPPEATSPVAAPAETPAPVTIPALAPAAPVATPAQEPPQTPPFPTAVAPEASPAAENPDVEGVVSFPPQPAAPPLPPSRPADLAKIAAQTPLPPSRPGDLDRLAAVTAPPPEAPPAASAPAPESPSVAPVPPASEAAQTPERTPAPDAPLPPTRPRELAGVAASTRVAAAPADQATPAQPAAAAPAPPAAAAPTTQVARLPEPALRPAPEDAFQQPPPKFGMGDQVFVRIFKQEGQLELWLRKNGRFNLYKTFPICKWSGRLGPKIKEADYQSPEGFYSVSARQLNPHSNYHRAFNVGYPNAFDRQNGRTGGLVMVHGACKSVGCFAMTDRGIEEIYGFVEAALRAGQKEIAVHIFPFRMTDAAIARETGGGWLAFVGGGGNYAQWTSFWKNLKQGYDLFERTGEPPVAFACGDHYEFDGGGASCRRVAGW